MDTKLPEQSATQQPKTTAPPGWVEWCSYITQEDVALFVKYAVPHCVVARAGLEHAVFFPPEISELLYFWAYEMRYEMRYRPRAADGSPMNFEGYVREVLACASAQ